MERNIQIDPELGLKLGLGKGLRFEFGLIFALEATEGWGTGQC